MKSTSQFKEKIDLYKKVIQNTIINLQKYKLLDLITGNDLNQSIQSLEKNFTELNDINNLLQNVNKVKLNKFSESDWVVLFLILGFSILDISLFFLSVLFSLSSS